MYIKLKSALLCCMQKPERFTHFITPYLIPTKDLENTQVRMGVMNTTSRTVSADIFVVYDKYGNIVDLEGFYYDKRIED